MKLRLELFKAKKAFTEIRTSIKWDRYSDRELQTMYTQYKEGHPELFDRTLVGKRKWVVDFVPYYKEVRSWKFASDAEAWYRANERAISQRKVLEARLYLLQQLTKREATIQELYAAAIDSGVDRFSALLDYLEFQHAR